MQCVQQTLLPMSQFISPGLRVMLALAGTRLETRSVTDHVVVGTPGKVRDEEIAMMKIVIDMGCIVLPPLSPSGDRLKIG